MAHVWQHTQKLEITMKRVEMKKSIIKCDEIFTKIQRVSASKKAINLSAQKSALKLNHSRC